MALHLAFCSVRQMYVLSSKPWTLLNSFRQLFLALFFGVFFNFIFLRFFDHIITILREAEPKRHI